MTKPDTVTMRCDDNAEAVVFSRYDFGNGDINYEINIEDSYCGGDYMGIKGRFKRAWRAFFAKPIFYSGVFVEDGRRMQEFLDKCQDLMRKDNKDEGN